MGELELNYEQMLEASKQIGDRITKLVFDSFGQAPAAAQAAAGANAGFLTSQALLALCAQIATAMMQLQKATKEQADLLKATAETVKERDAQLAAKSFAAADIFPKGV